MRAIDQIIDSLSRAHPSLVHEQLRVLHPGADDNGVWLFRHPGSPYDVQLESPSGDCPFLYETDERHAPTRAGTVEEAVLLVATGLGLVPPQPN